MRNTHTLTSTMEEKNNLYQRYASDQEIISEKCSQTSVVDNEVECDGVSVDSYNDDYFELFLQDLDNEDKAIQPVLDCSADDCNETLDDEISKLETTLQELEEDNLGDFEDEGKLALNTNAVSYNCKNDQIFHAGAVELLEGVFLNEDTNNSTLSVHSTTELSSSAQHILLKDKNGDINDHDLSDNLSSSLLNAASKTQGNEDSVPPNSTEFDDPDEGRVPQDQPIQSVVSYSSLKPKHLFLGKDFVVLDESGNKHSDELPLRDPSPLHSVSRTPVGKENISSKSNFRSVSKLDVKALNLATEAENVPVEHSFASHEFIILDEYRAMSDNESTPSHFNSSSNIGPVLSHNFQELDLVSHYSTLDKNLERDSGYIVMNQTSEKIEGIHSLDSTPVMNNENNPNVGNIQHDDSVHLPGSQIDNTAIDLNLLEEDRLKYMKPITDESKSCEGQNVKNTSFTGATSSVDESHSIELKATIGDSNVDSPDVLENESKEAEKSVTNKNEIKEGRKQETVYVETVIQPADEDFVSNDPQENADNNNPEWEVLRKLETDEERYKAMRQRWRSLVIPDPNQNLTFLHCKYKPNKERGIPASSNPLRENETQKKSKKRKRNKTVEPSSSANENPSKRLRTKSCTTIFDRKVEELQRTVEDKKHQLRVEEQLALENLGARQSVEHLQLLNSNINPYRFAILRDQLYQRQREDFELLRERYAHAQLSAEVEVKSKMDAIMKAMEEVRAFHSFYQGLDTEATNKNCLLLTDTELEDILDYERLDEKYKIFYK